MKELANNSTNEDLIEFAKEQCEIFPEDSYMGKYIRDTLKILQAEPCEDCVSRKSLIHKLQERHDFFVDAYGGFINLPQKDKARVDAIATCIAMVVNEPPVEPTRKKGKWIETKEGKYKCSNCKGEHSDTQTGKWYEVFDFKYHYCPNCGAEMESKE